MRHRVSTFSLVDDISWTEHASRIYEHPNGVTRVNSFGSSHGISLFSPASHFSDMSDYSYPPLRSNNIPSFYGKVYRPKHPVQPCHHETSTITFQKDVAAEYHFEGSLGFQGEFEDINTHNFPSGGTFLMHDMQVTDVADAFASAPSGSRANPYGVDWFALTDSFLEACDSFVPQSFFLGEDMAENDIFIDALKLVINPSRSLRTLIKAGVDHVKKFRKKTLGHVVKELSRNAANSNLFYQFGVKPAVADLKRALSAHSVVSKRMKFLSNHLGQWVPIRVKTKSSSPVSDYDPGSVDYSSYTSLFCNYTKNDLVACITGLGQVRADLTYGESWKAYVEYFGLNKVVGLAWELIPFSFVVDWFTNAQERLNSLTRLRTGGPFVSFKDICYSQKWTSELTLFAKPGLRSNSSGDKLIHPADPFPVAKKTTVVYDRFLSPPDTSGVVDTSTFGLFHSMILGCLTVQFLSKR
jgi:hypothetical protein